MTGIRGHFSVSLTKFFDHTGTESSTFSPGKISDVIITCPIIKIVTKQDDKLLRSQGEVTSHAFFFRRNRAESHKSHCIPAVVMPSNLDSEDARVSSGKD